MFRLIISTFLLNFILVVNAQQKNCYYNVKVQPGLSTYIYNRKYQAGIQCQWHTRSDYPMMMHCNPFELPESPKCSLDVVRISTNTSGSLPYCGRKEIIVPLEAKSYNIDVSLSSSSYSPGGTFSCRLETVEVTENCICGWHNTLQIQPRIVGGAETKRNEYPMMAGLIDLLTNKIFCGATIINSRQLLTAAHCVHDKSPLRVKVTVGDHDLSKNANTLSKQVFGVEKIILHPKYLKHSFNHDIAVITLNGIIRFDQNVGPACLPFEHSQDTFGGVFAEIMGWGTTEFAGEMSNTLQQTELRILTKKECRRTYKNLGNAQFCTLAYGKDSCQSDSGGPVLWRNPSTNRFVVIGIISYGSLCADGKPGVNTQVGAYIDWILSVTRSNFPYCQDE